MQHPRERRFNNRRDQRPYPSRHNANQALSSSHSHNDNFHHDYSYNSRNPHEDYRSKNSRYNRREYRNAEGEYFKTNAYQRRQIPYDKHKSHYSRNPVNRDFNSGSNIHDSRSSTSYGSQTMDLPLISPEEAKAIKLINAVKSQNGIGSILVLLQTENDTANSVIQNSVQSIKNAVLSVTPTTEPHYELRINGEFIVGGEFAKKQAAKSGLCELALDILKKTCFFILKKKNYEEISTDDIGKTEVNTAESGSMQGSKAHLMMLKMGWGGKGLGVNEQGAEKTVAETMTRNITKEGLGGKNIMGEINNILEEFARSAKVTTLAFDSGFTKEERAHIHSLAAKFNLKSKSEGKGDNRRITIGKKIAKWDLVKELLITNCENDSYKLIIPSDFESIWTED